MRVRLRTAHGTYLRAGDQGEVNQTTKKGPWEEFEIEGVEEAPPPPVPPLVFPLVIGNWQGNFLYPEKHFFPPACAAFLPDRRAAYFQSIQNRGDTHVLINAEQADWGPSKGHPEWTAGGYSAYGETMMRRFVDTLKEARSHNLSPVVGVVDQPTLSRQSLGKVITLTRQLVEATYPLVSMYMLSWEINEVWGDGGVREPNLERWIKDTDWHGRDVGIHFSAGVLSGGINFYSRMPSNVVRLYQYEASASKETLRHESRLIGEVAARTGTKACAFEHSSPVNQSPTYTESQAIDRAWVCKEELNLLLPSAQMGSLNG